MGSKKKLMVRQRNVKIRDAPGRRQIKIMGSRPLVSISRRDHVAVGSRQQRPLDIRTSNENQTRLAALIDISGTLVCHPEKPGVRLFLRDRARLCLDSQPAGFLPASVLPPPSLSPTLPPTCFSAYDRPTEQRTQTYRHIHAHRCIYIYIHTYSRFSPFLIILSFLRALR